MPYSILLVDDDKVFQQEFIASFDDYSIVPACSGEEALKILSKPHEIDLVLLDVMLPGQRGTKILKKLKKTKPELKVIILTGYSNKDIAIEALKADADDYLEKPLDLEKAAAIFEQYLKYGTKRSNLGASSIEEKIARVKEYIQRNYHTQVSLNDAAKIVFLSPKYLSRVFAKVTGQGFNQFKLSCKIDKAKELLQKSSLTIEQISYQLGYQNIESFVRIFKKFTGKRPTQFRKKKKK
ncbi:MAG: response regulator [Candidatus Omnitrophica bacterium]|nr:response regulator [Candidatus Omnitrophota bacterium]MCF7894355.1 response regulator [Candidatus Omnitrophota bacterium]